MLTVTIVYDNNAYDRRLTTSWGFAALVEFRGHTLLFDTGGDGRILLRNMRALGIDPSSVESVVLSHAHGDHTTGLYAVLEAGARPMVYMLPSFADVYKRQVRNEAPVVEVTPWQRIFEGMYTTGEMGHNIPEQSLVIRTSRGLVIITGCAHPGIVEIVEHALEFFDESVYFVLGGFHLRGDSKTEIKSILTDFQRLGVEWVAPCHCTGERALAMFSSEYGENFIQVGVGRVITVDVVEQRN